MAKEVTYTANDNSKLITVSEGDCIIREGEKQDEMYKIIKGKAEIHIGYGTENETVIGILKEGDCFGEFGLLLHEPAIYTIIAYSDMLLFRVTEGKMGEFITDNQVYVHQIMKSMALTMMRMQHQINQLTEELDESNKNRQKIVNENKEILKRYICNKKYVSDHIDGACTN